MSALPPVAVYGLTVPAGDEAVEADGGIPFPATFRITMAAIDPTAKVASSDPARSTLKLVKITAPDFDDSDEEDEDDDDIEAIERRLAGRVASDDESEEESDDEEKNGGPSDPAKSKRARAEAMLKAALEEVEDEDMGDADVPNGVNGTKVNKGKGKATSDEEDEDEDEEDEEEEEDEDEDIKEYVICTLDADKNYQQPLDITINNENEMCYFKVTGPYNVYLTGNFVIPPDADEVDKDDDESDDEDALLPTEIDEYTDEEESEEDELDMLEDPRITELEADEEEAPKLAKAGKGKNKRPAEESEEESEDEAVAEDVLKKILKPAEAPVANSQEKLTKKQKKKLKNNAGEAVPATAGADKKGAKATAKDAPAKDSPANGKKVQFAKNLEQGPTPTKTEAKPDAKPGVKVVQGVTVDDKKIGSGKQAKKGTRVELRYIGKLKDGKVFDANKKGKPFSFKMGSGEVIQGMDIGVQGMAIGGERRITIPAKLAYGSKKTGDIPPNSDLIFDLKLLSVS